MIYFIFVRGPIVKEDMPQDLLQLTTYPLLFQATGETNK